MPARVPEYNNFRVTPNIPGGGGLSTGVSQADAAAAAAGRESQRIGQEIQNAGRTLVNMEVDALQQANQIRVDDSLNQLKEASLNLEFDPENGYNSLKGLSALERPDNQSLTDEYGSRLETRASEIEAGLANDAQKRAFRLNANRLLTSFRGSVQAHESNEFRTYSVSVRDGTIANRTNEIGLNYNHPEIVEQAVNSIRAATYDKARTLGKSAEWAENEAREAASSGHRLAIQTALQNNNPVYASQYLEKFSKDMSADDILAVNGSLTKQLDGQVGLETANKVIQEKGPRIQTSESDRAFNIALGTESNYRQFDKDGKPLTSSAGAIGIAQVMPGTAPEAAKLAGLAWDENRYKNDADYNRALGKAYFDKQLVDFNGNLAQAYAAYNAGPGKTTKTGRTKDGKKLPGVRPAMARAAAKGTPQDWLSELPTETQNYVAKNMKAFGAGAGNFQKPTLVELQNEVRQRIGVGNPDRLKVALDEVERQYNGIITAEKQRNEEAVATAMRGLLENGGRFTDLPANVRGAIPPGDVVKVMDFGKRVALGDDTTNLWLYNKLSSNPQALRNMSDDEFFALRAELSQADYKHFSDERAKMITGNVTNGPGDLNNGAINRTLNDRLTSMGMDPTPKDGSDDAARVGAIRRFVNQSIAVEQANRGKKMNDVEVSQFIDSLLVEQNGVFSESFWGSPRITKTSDIPSRTRSALEAAFKRNGINNPSDADLLNAYWRHMRRLQEQKKAGAVNG